MFSLKVWKFWFNGSGDSIVVAPGRLQLAKKKVVFFFFSHVWVKNWRQLSRQTVSPLLLSDRQPRHTVAFVFLSGLRNSVWLWCQQTRSDIVISQSNEKNSWWLSHGRRILAANLNALECCFLFVRWIVSANEANVDLTHSGWGSPWFGSGAIVIVTPALRKKLLERTAHSCRLEITWAQQHFSTVYLHKATSQQYYNILSSLEKKLFYVLCSCTN